MTFNMNCCWLGWMTGTGKVAGHSDHFRLRQQYSLFHLSDRSDPTSWQQNTSWPMTSVSKTKVKNRDAWDSISKEDSTSKNNVMVLFSSSCRGLGWGCLSITETYRTNTNKKTRSNRWPINVSMMHLQLYWLLPIDLCLEGKKSQLEYFASTGNRLVACRGSSASGGTLSNISSMVNWPLSWVFHEETSHFWILVPNGYI